MLVYHLDGVARFKVKDGDRRWKWNGNGNGMAFRAFSGMYCTWSFDNPERRKQWGI